MLEFLILVSKINVVCIQILKLRTDNNFICFLIILDPDVRYVVFENLDRSFDFYLAQVHNLTALFMAMNDVNFEIREMALCTIGRLSLVNPAYVMPPLRKTLMQVCLIIY